MIRAFRMMGVLDCGPEIPDCRDRRLGLWRVDFASRILCSALICLGLFGCAKPKEEPIWEKVKIGDLAPSGQRTPGPTFVKGINLEIHVIDVPTDNISKIDDIRKKLYVEPLKLKSYQAFDGNSFLARFGQANMWGTVRTMLTAANGQEAARVALMLPDGEMQTLAITGLPHAETVFYTAADGSRQGANVGPGVIGLRIKGKRTPGRIGVCEITAYPVFSLPTANAIPELEAQMKKREFPFTAAAFGLPMSPGDFVFLAPKEYVNDQTELGGLFFTNFQGRMFLDSASHKPPERKTAVRVFLIACTRIDV